MCGLGVGWMPSAERRGRDATGMSSGMGWFGMDGLALLAADVGAAGGAAAGVVAADVAGLDLAPLAFAGVFLAAGAGRAGVGAGEGEGLAGGVARGVLRLVALVSVGCMVGGRTVIGDAALPGGEPVAGRTDAGVGGSVDENISPE